MRRWLNALNRRDPTYDQWAARHQSASSSERWRVVGLHLLPGLWGLAAVKLMVPALGPITGLSPAWLQLLTLGTMAIGWELAMPFVWLRRDGLSFRESLEFLGLAKLDWPGILVVAPIATVVFAVLGFPYLGYLYEPVRAWLDQWSIIQMPPWHILYSGYYNFPALPLLVVFIGNFLGEEVYFRGYLLKRLGFLGSRAWLASNFLFCFYHLWQAPVNWAYLPIFFLIPFAQIMAWRKSLWVTIVVHIMVNFGLADSVVTALKGLFQ